MTRSPLEGASCMQQSLCIIGPTDRQKAGIGLIGCALDTSSSSSVESLVLIVELVNDDVFISTHS